MISGPRPGEGEGMPSTSTGVPDPMCTNQQIQLRSSWGIRLLVCSGPVRGPLAVNPRTGLGDPLLRAQVCLENPPRVRLPARGDGFGRSDRHDLAAGVPSLGPEIDDVVGRL